MTNTRITATQALEWTHCPWCGRKLELDQELDAIVRDNEGTIDVERSEANGFDFSLSVKHCGYHVRLWVPEYDDEALIDV
jgi:hypothetical protein